MKYAGKSYGGQLASVGRTVVANYDGSGIVAGFVECIDDDGTPALSFYGTAYRVADDPEDAEHGGQYFVQTKTVEEVESLPANAWTWPVRV